MSEYEVEITQEAGGSWIGLVVHVTGEQRETIGQTKLKNQRGEAVSEAHRIAKAHKGPEVEKLDV
jgi:hypothetical protein